jgi:hypothetical protein
MTRKDLRIAGAVILLVACMVFTGCGQDPDPEPKPEFTVPEPEPEFTASEFTISAENAVSELGITPVHVSSSDEAVVVAELVEGGVTITSTGKGTALVSVSDFRSESNAANIDVTVDATGNIIANINKFEGNLVVAIIKEPVSVAGTVGNEIIPKDVRLMLDNNDFIEIIENDDVSSWVSNLPQGLSVKISNAGSGQHVHEITITISGTPLAAYKGILAITIPAEHTGIEMAVNVDPNEYAQFEISAASGS